MEFDPVLVHEWLRRSARLFPEKAALICGDLSLSYAELDQQSDCLARGFLSRGIQPGDRVVIYLENRAEAVIALYGALKAGAVFSIVSPLLKAEKLAHILSNAGATCLCIDPQKAPVVQEALREELPLKQIVWIGTESEIPEPLRPRTTCWSDLVETSDATPPVVPRIDRDLATLVYTSASTGEAKGVMSTHHNVVSSARSIMQYLSNTPDDILLNVLPLSFDYGLYQVLMTVMFGGTLVLERGFVFLHETLSLLGRRRVTGFPIVPTILAMMLKMQHLENYDLSHLRYITNTGAALPAEHILRFRDLFPQTEVYSMFGLTECKRVSYLSPEELDEYPLSVGHPIPNCDAVIVNEDGKEVPPGETGELVVRGSNVTQGYWNDPELTARTFRSWASTGEKALFTGDYFRRDEEGRLYFLGRRDDMIKRGGERISPREVENVLCRLDRVSDAAVVGIPDEIFGQVILAFVEPSPGASLTEQDVLSHCTSHMEHYMVPKSVVLVDRMPKTPNGKTDKKKLMADTQPEGSS